MPRAGLDRRKTPRRKGSAVFVPRPPQQEAHLPPAVDRSYQCRGSPERYHVLPPDARSEAEQHSDQPQGPRRPGDESAGGLCNHRQAGRLDILLTDDVKHTRWSGFPATAFSFQPTVRYLYSTERTTHTDHPCSKRSNNSRRRSTPTLQRSTRWKPSSSSV